MNQRIIPFHSNVLEVITEGNAEEPIREVEEPIRGEEVGLAKEGRANQKGGG